MLVPGQGARVCAFFVVRRHLERYTGRMNLRERVQGSIAGEAEDGKDVLSSYSRDASLFEVRPRLVAFPRDASDVCALVRFVNSHPEEGFSLTCRSGGSDMSGGPLGDSIIVDMRRHLNAFEGLEGEEAAAQPGIMYEEFEKETLAKGLLLPSYPASRSLCTLGGMIMNNAGGERTLRYGKTESYISSLRAVLADGNEYEIRPLTPAELEEKKRAGGFEGRIYSRMHHLILEHRAEIERARPDVRKNSAGYALWNVWDGERFDLTKLFCGSQGTLGIVTRAVMRLVRPRKHRRLAVVFLRDLRPLPDLVNAFLPLDPEGLESFDDSTLKLALRFFPAIARKIKGQNLFTLALQFLPEFLIGLRMLGLPRMVVLVQISEDAPEDADRKMEDVRRVLERFPAAFRILRTEQEAEKYWVIRRESFSLLRQRVRNMRTAPFVDDFIVQPRFLPEVLPAVMKIMKRNGIRTTIAGHAGSGNFHIIPLMDLRRSEEREKILRVADEVYDLVLRHGGSITAEHNDGIIRTPYLERMFGEKMIRLFEETKEIFDPLGIFNPGKKVGGTRKDITERIALNG